MSDTGTNDAAAGFSVQLKAADGSIHMLSGEMRVGRSKDCEIYIEDSRVSRGHALISVVDERVTVEDLGSVNGTRVNGLRVEACVELRDGDSLMFDKHTFKVVVVGAAVDADATVIDSDATVIGGFEPESVPAPAPAPEPAPAPAPALPGSWVESGTSEHTQILMPGAKLDMPKSTAAIERKSELPHLLVLTDDGGHELLELELSPSGDQDIWEIGRGDTCEILLSDPSVSVRHAQLIHKGGRWRLVNMVSANGLFVNDEKRLTAYLSDGDEIRLGRVKAVFMAAAGAPAVKKSGGVHVTGTSGGGGKGLSKSILMAGVIVVVVVALVLWQLF